MALIVQKYGGTSVGDERIRRVLQRVERARKEGHHVVVACWR
ncbi:MAG: hypothetical protein R3B08_00320 [Nitrospira sp.]